MNKKLMIKQLLIMSVALFSTQVFSQVTSTIQTPTARSTAIGASNVTMGGSAELLFTNPALLAEFEGFGAIAGYQNLFSQSFVEYSVAGVSYDTGNDFGNLGLTLTSLGTTNGDASLADETTIGLHYGSYLMKDRLTSLAIGVTLNYMQISYGASAGPSGDGSDGMTFGSTSEIGMDIGLVATLGKKHRAGVLAKNINGPTIGSGGTQTALPQVVIAGFSYSPVEEVITTFSLNYTLGYPIEFHGGLEYKLNANYSILTGMVSQPNRLSAGFKINAKGINMEYGVITHPVLPLTHVLTLSLHLKGLNQ